MRSSGLRWLGATLTLIACTARSGGGGGGFIPVDAASGDAVAPGDAPVSADVSRDDVVAPADAGPTEDAQAPADAGMRLCTPSEVTCASDTSLRVCSADGTSANTVPCGAGTRCSGGQCVANLCAPNGYSCGPSGRRVCNAQGTEHADSPCPGAANSTSRCEGNGVCALACNEGYADCDGASANGCERSLREDGANCGACGRSCASGSMCMNGSCLSSCGALTQCGGACVDTRSSAGHCGRCDNPCTERPNAPPVCRSGACALECAGTFADCDFNLTTGCEADLQTSGQHCGGCGRACAAGQSCVAGRCQTAVTPRSCREVLTQRPGTPSGPQRIDPDGTGVGAAFEVYCDMTAAAGGWTLVAVISNSDAANWTPRSLLWVNTTTLGSATTLGSTDAKTPAYSQLSADELLVVRGGATTQVELQTATGCLRNQTMLQVMSVSSSNTTSCARSCTAVTQTGLFSSASTCHGAGVRFRCRDDLTTITVGGFLISSDDNSMITSMTNAISCTAYQSGLGAMSTSTLLDIDGQSSSVLSPDSLPRYVFVR